MLFKEKKLIDPKKHGLFFLNLTQFSVVLVDNIFKLIIAFFLIDLVGKEKASQVLSTVGAVYVMPFLLLSSLGGSLADRFSKRTITIIIKLLGGVILLSSLYVFHIKSELGCYILLFLLSVQSAVFGPSKYGMIPELVPHSEISKANGHVTSFTYLAIIFGTFLGSFLSELFDKNYIKVLLVTFIFSLTGIISSFFIPKLEASRKGMGFSASVFKETFEVIKHYPKKTHLGIAMFSSAFFLMIGAFTQLGIIPYAITVLDKTEFVGGYLFLTTALGIALGSQVVGKLSKKGPSLIYPAIGGLIIGFMMIGLGFFVTSIKSAIFCLVFLGIAGGFYIVPIDAFIQLAAKQEHRGRILGLNNLLGFTGVLVASFLLFLLSHVMKLKPNEAFLIIGILDFLFISVFIAKTSDRLLAIWFKVKYLKSSPLTIIPSNVDLLIVPKRSMKYLSSLIFSKTRVRIVTDKSHILSPSMFLKSPSFQSLLDSLNQDLDEESIVILEKSLLNFDLKAFKGKVGEIEEVLK
jgi:acyl-[acyl-carrier-protein]-phospholipid O-acyltransferase / long-chain-fatty-acid--[acyl-carrier-protein] ligase